MPAVSKKQHTLLLHLDDFDMYRRHSYLPFRFWPFWPEWPEWPLAVIPCRQEVPLPCGATQVRRTTYDLLPLTGTSRYWDLYAGPQRQSN